MKLASHRHTERTPEQGDGSWLITDKPVLESLPDRPYDIDLRKVGSLWFMDLFAPYFERSITNGRRAEAA